MKAMRSIPTPKAKPEYFSGSILTWLRPWDSPSGAQELYPAQPFTGRAAPSSQIQQETSICAEGSVKGKKTGENVF